MKLILTLLTLLSLVLSPTALAQDAEIGEAEHIARDYMAAYSGVDFETMATFMAEDMMFSDPTATGTDNPVGIQTEGREATLAMLNAFAAQYNPIELGFVWDTVFESNNRVVFMGHVNAIYPTDDPTQVFRWRAAQTAVVTVMDGQVVRHQDFANYSGAEQGLIPAE